MPVTLPLFVGVPVCVPVSEAVFEGVPVGVVVLLGVPVGLAPRDSEGVGELDTVGVGVPLGGLPRA